MRKNFFFSMSIIYWLFMMIGFSDNWLYDTNQASNFIFKFQVHAFFAFSWFSLLVVQTGLIRKANYKLHQQIGITGMVIFVGLILSTGYLYLSRYLELGYMAPLSKMVFSQYLFAIVLIVIGFAKRKTDTLAHKTNIIFGSFMLMQPAIDRMVGHLFDDVFVIVWLAVYFILFGLFIWYYKKIKWQFAAGFTIWLAGLMNMIMNGGL
ncbi:MAG TPA: hypothetical protein PLJ60_05120 [Chryseolinea sp.]|nr:hypothetical protein [Chryseolinea sp.]HPM29700.1 hypothetical protein [Chryseolinea sp.]